MDFFRDLFSPPRHLILPLAAAWLGVILAERRAARHSAKKNDLNNLAFHGMIAFILGGRVAFALEHLPAFVKSPLGVFSLSVAAFDPTGGFAAACVAGLVYGQRHNLKFWTTLDALAPFFAVVAVGLGLGNFAAGAAYGAPTNLPIGIELWNATRHPVQIYESLAALLILGLILLPKPQQPPGISFLFFAAATAFARVIVQGFRADGALVFGFRQSQIAAWLVLGVCFILIELRLKERA